MKKVIANFLAGCGVLALLSLTSGCGGGGNDTTYELPPGQRLSIAVGPADSASPETVDGIPVNLNRVFSILFEADAGLIGSLSFDSEVPVGCTYSVRGDINGEFDLDISWFETWGTRQHIAIRGANLKTRTMTSWDIGRDVGDSIIFVRFTGSQGTIMEAN